MKWNIFCYLLKLVRESGSLKYRSDSLELYKVESWENSSFNINKWLKVEILIRWLVPKLKFFFSNLARNSDVNKKWEGYPKTDLSAISSKIFAKLSSERRQASSSNFSLMSLRMNLSLSSSPSLVSTSSLRKVSNFCKLTSESLIALLFDKTALKKIIYLNFSKYFVRPNYL